MPLAELVTPLVRLAATTIAALFAGSAFAGPADVLSAKAEPLGQGRYQVSATVQHADEGWDHYANAFEVLAPDGTLLGTRVLHHPHVDEQPFTRSTTLSVPDDLTEIVVRALDSVHGAGGAEVVVPLPDRQ